MDNEQLALQKAILWLEQVEDWIDADDRREKSPLENRSALENSRVAKAALVKYMESLTNKATTESLDRVPHLHAYVAKLNQQNIALFASHPRAHDNIGLAVREAERLAKQEPGHKFAVFTALGYYQIPSLLPLWVGTTTRP